jgi:hypothetical protein
MLRVEVAAGTLCDTAVCELFPPRLDAIRVLPPRYAVAGVVVPRVDLDIVGDDAARKRTSG